MQCKAQHIVVGFREYEIRSTNKLMQNLKKTIRTFKPDIAIVQGKDYHPDHCAVHGIALTALEFASHGKREGWFTPRIFEMEATGLFSYPDIIVDVSEEHAMKKKIFLCHTSQVNGKDFGEYYLDILECKGRLRGAQIGVKYGEAYCVCVQKIIGDVYPVGRGITSPAQLLHNP
jgi:LmbE family N-acetylglucosaminyl deacetylase